MDTLQVIALIVVVLVILAFIIAFRKKIVLKLKAWGIDLGLEAENAPAQTQTQPASPPPTGIRAHDLDSNEGGIYLEEGRTTDPAGTGIDASKLKARGDIIIGKGESGDPKAPPPT